MSARDGFIRVPLGGFGAGAASFHDPVIVAGSRSPMKWLSSSLMSDAEWTLLYFSDASCPAYW